jgi:hypothetical protein
MAADERRYYWHTTASIGTAIIGHYTCLATEGVIENAGGRRGEVS